MRRTVLEFARAPVLGRVKRRLAATEGDPEALRIYRLLAEDVHAVLLEAQSLGDVDLVTCLADGREVIDGMSSWWAAIHGYGHPVLDAAVSAQVGRMSHVMFGGLTHEPAAQLARRLIRLTPESLQKVREHKKQAKAAAKGA